MSTFPHPAYSRVVLQPSFEMAQAHLFMPMLRANQAHVVMLAGQGIISQAKRDTLLSGLLRIATEGSTALRYEPGVEDLFFAMERRLIELVGPEAGGDLQLARSRNDLGAALHRMVLRDQLLRLSEAVGRLRAVLIDLAGEHVNTLMPGYTHTQPAQPTTFAHYLGGVLTALERDAARLRAAYATTNQSPLGAAAFTGSGFPVDRRRLAALLGFDGVLENGQDAIGAADHATDTAAALLSLASHLSRLTHDLLFWATREAGAIRIDDSFVQISSIMPQKRNPVVLEHLRARLAQVYGDGVGIFTMVHACPYGDTQDVEDELMFPLLRLIGTARDLLELYAAAAATLQVDHERLRSRAAEGFTTATELADTLVRDYALPFRTAHQIVARVVRAALDQGHGPDTLTAAEVERAANELLGRAIGIDDPAVRAALDPQRFIERRTIAGGPAPEATQAWLDGAAARLRADQSWLRGRRQALAHAEARLVEQARPAGG